MTVCCLVELDGGAVTDASLRALTFARGLAVDGSGLMAVLFGEDDPGAAAAAELTAFGVTRWLGVTENGGYAPLAQARVLARAAGGAEPASILLAAATEHGAEVMAHVAAITGLPLAANCTAVAPGAAGEWQVTRQRWAGLLLEEAVISGPTALLTVAPEAAEAVALESVRQSAGTGELLADIPADEPGLVVRADQRPAGAGGGSLASARVVVGGGRGVGGAGGFAPLEELAGLLGGVVGVSRVVTSEGWRPHSMQVGQTGTKITPDLYLACGISGAIQHFAGCSGARHIIAVNTDPGAPMMTRADYAVVGDLHQVLPALISALRDRAAGQPSSVQR